MAKLKDLLTRVVMRMADDLVEAKNEVALAKNEERRLGRLADACARAADERASRAMAAVRAGDDVVAKEALLRKREHQREAADSRAAHQKQQGEVQRLTGVLSDLNRRVEEAKGKMNAVISRARRARAEDSIASTVVQWGGDAPLEVLRRVEAVIAAIEDQAGLLPELTDQALESSERASEPRIVEADLLLMKGTEASRERRTKR
jgi:phage shock protein A